MKRTPAVHGHPQKSVSKSTLLSELEKWGSPIICGSIFAFLAALTGYLLTPSNHSPWEPVSSFSSAIKRVAPAVVNIATISRSANQTNLGSGVIVDKQGHIITNFHVIKDASQVTVTLADGRKTIATILGGDEESDIAVLKISLIPLPPPPQSQSQENNASSQQTTRADRPVEIGDIVLAIGNPYGVGQSVTQGIVSAINRSNLGLTTFEKYIQTDAAINPGNSGGALITTDGRLIGINSAFLSHKEGVQGISFAIPTTQIAAIKRDIIRTGKVVRGYLGVRLHQLNEETSDFFNLAHTNGLVVVDIDALGPAKKAGLQQGDIILEINNTPLKHNQDSLFIISGIKPQTAVLLSIYRTGKIMAIQATLEIRPSSNAADFH